jgi:hypothetical protein
VVTSSNSIRGPNRIVMLFTVSKGVQLYREMKSDAGWRRA